MDGKYEYYVPKRLDWKKWYEFLGESEEKNEKKMEGFKKKVAKDVQKDRKAVTL